MKASVSDNPKPKKKEDADKAKNAFGEVTRGVGEKNLRKQIRSQKNN